MSGVAVGVFVFLFLLVTVMGFAAARWRISAGTDHTQTGDYTADLGDEGVQAELDQEVATH